MIAQTAITARPLEPALYLVATPIGNLSDITLRALETLAAADIVACEDTRVTRVLLDRYGIRQRSTPYHEHNADEAGPRLIAALRPARAWRWSRMPARRWSPIPATAWSNGRWPRHQGRADPRRFGRACRAHRLGAAFRYVPVRRLSAVEGRAAAEPAGSAESRPATLIFFESPRRLAETLAAMVEASRRRAARRWSAAS